MKRYKFFLIFTCAQLVIAEVFASSNYKNTEQEKLIFQQFIDGKPGTLTCKAISDYIYDKGTTTFLTSDANSKKFYLSAYNNNQKQWTVQNIEMNLKLTYEGFARFRSKEGISSIASLDIGVDRWRSKVSDFGNYQVSEKYPYTGRAGYQSHNICNIKLSN